MPAADLVLKNVLGGKNRLSYLSGVGGGLRFRTKVGRRRQQIMLETLLIVAASGVGSLALIVRELRKAPEGYEDEHGFDIGICAY